jgi:hypothetical protein
VARKPGRLARRAVELQRPQAYKSVVAAAGEMLAVGAEGQTVHTASVIGRKGCTLEACAVRFQRPQDHPTVITPAGELFAVRTEGHAANKARVT